MPVPELSSFLERLKHSIDVYRHASYVYLHCSSITAGSEQTKRCLTVACTANSELRITNCLLNVTVLTILY